MVTNDVIEVTTLSTHHRVILIHRYFSQDKVEQIQDVEEVIRPDGGDKDELLDPLLSRKCHQVQGSLSEVEDKDLPEALRTTNKAKCRSQNRQQFILWSRLGSADHACFTLHIQESHVLGSPH